MLQEKMLLQIILCNLTYRLKFIANISHSIQNFNIRPGKPRAFAHHLCQGSGKLEPGIVRISGTTEINLACSRLRDSRVR